MHYTSQHSRVTVDRNWGKNKNFIHSIFLITGRFGFMFWSVSSDLILFVVTSDQIFLSLQKKKKIYLALQLIIIYVYISCFL